MTSTPTLLSVLRDRAAVRRYSPRTVQAYARWVLAYIRFHDSRHPRTLGPEHVRAYLTYLARVRGVAASTQNQALAALQFLYRDVLEQPLPSAHGIAPAKRPHVLPNVLSREDVRKVLAELRGATRLMALLLYGSGLRLQECCQLRLKDLDTDRGEIRVRRGKGERDRVTMLPALLVEPVLEHIRKVWCCTCVVCRRVAATSSCLVRSTSSRRMPCGRGRGAGCFRGGRSIGTRPRVSAGRVMSIPRHCSGP